MAVARWLETDTNTNKDISSAVSIGAYTADADRMIVCDVSLGSIAGNGDYVIYLTRQIGGAGSAYVMLPKTTCAAASGETAIAMQSAAITVRSGDVLTVYLDGLAGDTTTPDTTVRWFEMAALRPATADRTLAVDASGLVDLVDAPNATAVAAIQNGVILANGAHGGSSATLTLKKADINNTDNQGVALTLRGGNPISPGYAVALVHGNNTTGAGQIYGYVRGVVDAVALATESIIDTAFAASGLEAIRSALGMAAADLDTQLDAIAAGSGGSSAQEVWEYTTRTLTQSSTSTSDSTAAGSIARRRGDSWSISLTIGAITGYTSLWFTAKWDRDDPDISSVLQIKLNSPSASDGLLYVNGAAASDSTKGSITVSDDTTGAIIIAVDETITQYLPPAGLYYDIQVLTSGTVTTPDSGTLTISADVTRDVA